MSDKAVNMQRNTLKVLQKAWRPIALKTTLKLQEGWDPWIQNMKM